VSDVFVSDIQAEKTFMENRNKPGYTWFKLSLILLLGFGIRVSGLVWGQAYCQGSQGDSLEAYQVAVDYVRGEAAAQYLGQPMYNDTARLPGPLWTLFCVEGLKLGKGSIDGVVWLIILLNTGAIFLTYLLASRTIGIAPALWAALFMAVSPSTVFYSTVVFNPVVMPFLGGLLFLALWQAVQRERSRAIFWVPLLLLAMQQFHTSGLMLIPAVILALALSPVRLNFVWLAAGAIMGFCLYLPYIQGEMAHHWENTRGMMRGASNPYWPGTLRVLIAPLSFLVNIWTPGPVVYTPTEYRQMCRACFGSLELFLVVNALSVIATAFLICGALSRIRKAFQGFFHSPRAAFAQSPGIIFLAIILTVPLLASVPSGKVFQGRYCLVLLAPLFALAGAGFTQLLENPRLRRLVWAIILASTCATAWFMPAMHRFNYTFIQDGPRFSPGFAKLEAVYQSLKTHAGKGQRVQVEDTDYLQALPHDDQLFHLARLIRVYVAIREKQAIDEPDSPPPVVTYQLRSAAEVSPNDPTVAYLGNGIALTVQAARR
jgi:hypothetical protein